MSPEDQEKYIDTMKHTTPVPVSPPPQPTPKSQMQAQLAMPAENSADNQKHDGVHRFSIGGKTFLFSDFDPELGYQSVDDQKNISQEEDEVDDQKNVPQLQKALSGLWTFLRLELVYLLSKRKGEGLYNYDKQFDNY